MPNDILKIMEDAFQPKVQDQKSSVQQTHNQPFLIKYKYPLLLTGLVLTIFIIWWGYAVIISRTTSSQPSSIFPSVPPRPSPTPYPITDWKTYTNNKYGYLVKYPKDWNVDDRGDFSNAPAISGCINSGERCGNIQITRELPGTSSFTGAKLSKTFIGNSPQDYFQYKYGPTVVSKIFKADESFIDNVKAYDVVYQPSNPRDVPIARVVITLKSKYAYVIEMTEGYPANYYGIKSIKDWQLTPIFDQMLSTFKFLDQKEGVVCAQDVRQCPNGSYVNRQPPSCEFIPCQ